MKPKFSEAWGGSIRRLAFTLALAIGLTVPLGGCAGRVHDAWVALTDPNSTQAQLIAEKALVAAHDAHDLAALAASGAARSGACISTCASTVKDYIDKSEALLVQADAVTDATTIAAKVGAALVLIEKAKGML